MTGVVDEVIADPVGVVVRLVGEVDRRLGATRIREIVCGVVRARAGRRSLAQALRDDPTLLQTGRPPAPYCVARLLMALRDAGAQDVALPRCGQCGRERSWVGSLRGGQWACSPCSDKPAVCAGCGETRRVVSRDRAGKRRCAECPDTAGDPLAELVEQVIALDPALDTEAVLAALGRATVRPAGQRQLAWAVTARPDLLTGAGYDAPAPAVLRFIDELIAVGASQVVRPACPRCRQVKALSKLLDGRRVCRNCFARHAAVPCVRCGAVREPAARDTSGGGLCPNCLIKDPANLEECRGCGRCLPVAVRSPDGPRCMTCRPRTVTECGICGRTAVCDMSRVTSRPWCLRCQQKWVTCSGCGDRGPIRGGSLDAPLCARCVNPDPEFWGRCPVCETTWQLGPQPCQRCALDQRVRDLLGDDTGVVRDDLAERQILHGYAVWHHLRRLRQRLGEQHTTRLQDLNVRCHVTAAANFLDWLAARDRALAACTQGELDTWTSGRHHYRDETAHFVRWAVSHRHAHGLTFGAIRWHGPTGPHDTEKRWDDARRLLHDDTIKTPDRVAGLLLLLYTQRIATITQLTVDDVRDDGDTAAITFGRVPLTLPEPLATLVRELVANRKGSNIITAPDAKPWLFPGRRPGHPLGDDRLGQRLQQIGLKPRQDRSTALFALATEIPAAMLARMLGINIKVAVAWQQASSGDWTVYAADISRHAQTNQDRGRKR